MVTSLNDRSGNDEDRLRTQISERVAACLSRCTDLCRRMRGDVPRPVVRFDLHGQTAGQCIWGNGRPPQLRFNLALAQRHRDDFLHTTVAHEVAHLVTLACHGRTRPHGKEWRAVMRHLGIADPQRCHDYDTDGSATRRQRRWVYRCDCRQHVLSTTRHNRIVRRQAEYHCRHCGTTLRRAAADDGRE